MCEVVSQHAFPFLKTFGGDGSTYLSERIDVPALFGCVEVSLPAATSVAVAAKSAAVEAEVATA
jgi:hypothetical protein